MPPISLILVQSFYQLGRTGSFSGAAQELNLSHAAVSNQVRRLEQAIGERLVEPQRGARKVQMTARGAQLYALIKPEFDVMFSRLKQVLEEGRPILRLGMSQGAFQYLIAPVLGELRALHPGTGFEIFERDTALTDLVRQGRLDAFLSERHFGDPLVEQRLLGHYGLWLVHPADWGPSPDPDDLLDWAQSRPFVTYEPGQVLRDMVRDRLGFERAGVQPVIAASSSASVKRCVSAGLGFAILPHWALEPQDSHLRGIALPDLPQVPMYFGSARFLEDMPALQNLFALCRDKLSSKAP